MQPRFVLAAALSATVLSVLGVGLERSAAAMHPQQGGGPVVGGGGRSGSPQDLLPRLRVRKPARAEFELPYDPASGEAWYTGNIVLKFEDSVLARAPLASAPGVAALAPADLTGFQQILAENKLTVRQWINRTPEQLAALEQRAVAYSGRAQPDLAGMMIIENVHPKVLSEIAWAINELPEIEFANIERIAILHQCGPDGPGPCNAPAGDCSPEGFNCNPDPGDQDGDPDNTLFGCLDTSCCQIVAGFIPYCNDENSPNGWDIICAAYANLLCNGTIYDNVNPSLQDRYDPCFTDPNDINAVNPIFAEIYPGFQQGCFEPHSGRGCSRPACCFTVCTIDPACCNIEWDQTCVNLARSPSLENVCFAAPDPGATPDFTPFILPSGRTGGHQLYIQPGVREPNGDFPGGNAWSGRGLNLAGFEAVHTQIASTFLNGAAPTSYGEGVRVAVIEFSAFVQHEEFVLGDSNTLLTQPKVIPEAGQTILLTEGSNNAPQHGTAALGQIVSGNNGFGVTGIAYNAQGYFFPIVSVEEGSRPGNAMISAFELFEPGDVINHSWGSPPDRPLPAIPQFYTLIALGSDLGITSVVSAGNSNCPIQPQAGEEDSGVVIVGASSPGRRAVIPGCPGYAACFGRFLRLPFSNYSGGDGDPLAVVHVFAWGQAVTTTGYGDLFVGANGLPPGDADPENINRLRMYTDEFSGTSSAAPIITGAIANAQAMAKQVYGAALPPRVIRSILTGNGEEQCPLAISIEECGISVADCCVDGDPDCDGIFKPIGVLPNMRDVAVGIFTGTPWDGNRADIDVYTGIQPRGAPWVSYVIRAFDGSALRIIAERRAAGTVVEGVPYLASGFTTDVGARLRAQNSNPQAQVDDLGITTVSRATRNFVMLGVFARNFSRNRYEFIGAQLMTTAYDGYNFDVPNYGGMSDYLNPETNEVELRVWTCGLGQTRGHEVQHDLIQVRINDPFNPL